MTEWPRAFALLALAAVASSCAGIGSGSFNGKPADVYAVMPTQQNIRSLMHDDNWWEGVPSFEVPPLNAQNWPTNQRFAISETYLHVGTDEAIQARYAVYDKTSSATAVMNGYQSSYGQSPSSPKVGDQVLYYAALARMGAPYVAITFVRVGQIVVTLNWFRKDQGLTADLMAKNARVFVAPLKDLSKTRAKPRSADARELPPAGLSITPLGSATLPVESYIVLMGIGIPEQFVALMKDAGVSTISYGDYSLNHDTHMEVQTALLKFPSATDASEFAATFGPGKPDQQGIAFDYIPVGNTPAAGFYQFMVSEGRYVAVLVCRNTALGEAATRECEDPVHTVALAWKLALGGLR